MTFGHNPPMSSSCPVRLCLVRLCLVRLCHADLLGPICPCLARPCPVHAHLTRAQSVPNHARARAQSRMCPCLCLAHSCRVQPAHAQPTRAQSVPSSCLCPRQTDAQTSELIYRMSISFLMKVVIHYLLMFLSIYGMIIFQMNGHD